MSAYFFKDLILTISKIKDELRAKYFNYIYNISEQIWEIYL